MPVYRAPVQDSLFLLNDVLGVERYAKLPGFANATPDMIEAVLTEAGKFCEEVLFPINQSGDLEGCTRHNDGSVTTPKGFKEALAYDGLPGDAVPGGGCAMPTPVPPSPH